MTAQPAASGAASSLTVTGSTGHLGGLVARGLAADGTRLRLLVRDRSRAPELPGSEVVVASYGDAAAARAALAGTQVLFMVSATESAGRLAEHRTLLDAAADSGVRHVVYVSFLGAAPDATFTLARDHWQTERHVRESGMALTALRDSLYADFLPLLATGGEIRGPGGSGAVAAVARADAAAAAVAVLHDPAAHAGACYELTGPEALTLTQVAQVLTEVTGEPVRYVPQTVPQAYAARAASGAEPWQLDAWVSTYTAIAAGDLATVTGDVERLTGVGPRTVRQCLAGVRVPGPG